MKRQLVNMLNRGVLRRAGTRIVKISELYPYQLADPTPIAPTSRNGPSPEALAYLKAGNPRLIELRAVYSDFDPVVTSPLIWVDTIITQKDLTHFRGDNAFVYQVRGLQFNDLGYALTAYYTLSGAAGDLLRRMSEDGAFGTHVVEVAGRAMSRDVLDSAREIDFLIRHVTPANGTLKVLDIGAGYGRLPHRLTEVLGSDVEVYATDAFPFSTFLSEFYLRYRGSPARVIPLNEIERLLHATQIDVAVNIHSFSECTPEAINWWAALLAKAGVLNLMVIPNGESKSDLTICRTNDGHDMEAIFERHGYGCVAREFRYSDRLVREYGIDPAQLNMFRLGSRQDDHPTTGS